MAHVVQACDDEENWFINFLRDGVKVAIKDFSMGFAAAQLYAVFITFVSCPSAPPGY